MDGKAPWCQKWHSRLNIMLLVTACVADRLVGWAGWRGTVCQSATDADLTYRWHLRWNSGLHNITAAPWRARQDSPSHTNNNMHAVFTDNAMLFIFQSTHTVHVFFPCIFETDALREAWCRCLSLALRYAFIWLCNLKIHSEKEEREDQRRTWQTSVRRHVLQSFTDLFAVFIYLSTFGFIFLLERKKLSCNLTASLQILYILLLFLGSSVFLSE